MILREGGYLDEIRRWYGLDLSSEINVSLSIFSVHDEDARLRQVGYPVRSTSLRQLLDTWHTSEGRTDKLQKSITECTIAELLSRIDESDVADSCLSDLLQSVKAEKTTLRNEKTLPTDVLIQYACLYTIKVIRDVSPEGRVMYAIATSGSHNDLCNAAAAARRIPQQLSEAMRSWLKRCLRSELSLEDIDALLFNANTPLLNVMQPPPKPLETFSKSVTPTARFTLTTAYLRTLQKEHKSCLRFDADDETSDVLAQRLLVNWIDIRSGSLIRFTVPR